MMEVLRCHGHIIIKNPNASSHNISFSLSGIRQVQGKPSLLIELFLGLMVDEAVIWGIEGLAGYGNGDQGGH